MAAMPVETPVIIPVDEPMVATAGVPLSHVPPPEASVSVMLAPAHNAGGPEMPAGNWFMVMTLVTEQPVLKE